MATIFLVCAVVGSVIVVCQFLLLLLGIGHDVDHDFGGGGLDAGHGDLGHPGDVDHGHGGYFFGVLSFRSVVAALAVFGLAGMAMLTGGYSQAASLVAAVAGGAAALFLVAWLMRFLYGLRDDGTVHMERAVGHRGTVYLSIPGEHAGQGKVFLNLQNRTVECQAVTSKGALPTGSQVVVVGIVGPNVVEVEPWVETERENAVHV
jgi:membrane protein implicated in regulation of membrane protease activity